MKYKLLLINPVSTTYSSEYALREKYPPLALGIIANLTPDNWDITIKDENYDLFSFVEADLVAISSFTANICRAYEIAEVYKNKGIKVVLGGIHVSMLPDEACKYADCIAVGEAETTWPDIISDFEKGELKKKYTGTRTHSDNICHVKQNLFNDKYKWGSIQCSRGCQFACDYCTVSKFYGQQVRLRPVDSIIEEIALINKDFFWIVDENFFGNNLNQRQWALEICKKIKEKNFNKTWLCFANLDSTLDDEILKAASDAGCKMIFIGLESENEENIDFLISKKNLPSLYSEAFEKLHKYNICIFAGIIFGFDNDTEKSIIQRTQYLLEQPIDSYWSPVLTPMPGTKLFERLEKENRLMFTDFPADWSKYTYSNPVFTPINIEYQAYIKAVRNAYNSLYSFKNIKNKYKQSLALTSNRDLAHIAFKTNLDSARLFHL